MGCPSTGRRFGPGSCRGRRGDGSAALGAGRKVGRADPPGGERSATATRAGRRIGGLGLRRPGTGSAGAGETRRDGACPPRQQARATDDPLLAWRTPAERDGWRRRPDAASPSRRVRASTTASRRPTPGSSGTTRTSSPHSSEQIGRGLYGRDDRRRTRAAAGRRRPPPGAGRTGRSTRRARSLATSRARQKARGAGRIGSHVTMNSKSAPISLEARPGRAAADAAAAAQRLLGTHRPCRVRRRASRRSSRSTASRASFFGRRATPSRSAPARAAR